MLVCHCHRVTDQAITKSGYPITNEEQGQNNFHVVITKPQSHYSENQDDKADRNIGANKPPLLALIAHNIVGNQQLG